MKRRFFLGLAAAAVLCGAASAGAQERAQSTPDRDSQDQEHGRIASPNPTTREVEPAPGAGPTELKGTKVEGTKTRQAPSKKARKRRPQPRND